MNTKGTLLVASNNAGKIHEIKSILSGVFEEIVSLKERGIEHETIEDGQTFCANAIKKAEEAAAIAGLPALADDSGLCVDALHGLPGVHSARYSQEGDKGNNRKLLRALDGVPIEKRGARFESVVALARPGRETVTARGVCAGRLRFEEAGSGGFGYDPLFEPDGFHQTFAELSQQQKNAISHRRAALNNLLLRLQAEEEA